MAAASGLKKSRTNMCSAKVVSEKEQFFFLFGGGGGGGVDRGGRGDFKIRMSLFGGFRRGISLRGRTVSPMCSS